MPVSQRISDAELRQRLEEHQYNVPPITDSTRRTLINKLRQLDQDSAGKSRKAAYTGLDYSSAEDEEFPPPRASSTMVGRGRESGRGRQATNGGGRRGEAGGRRAETGGRREEVAVRREEGGGRRGTRSSRQNSRAGTPQTNGGSNGGGGGREGRGRRGLMHNSETEEGSEEEEEEEEEDICEEEEEEEEEESEEEDTNGVGGQDRVDLGVQTSLLDSPSPVVSSTASHTQRFRGQAYGSSPSTGPSYSSTPTYPMSSYLRHRINTNSSLGEALATLPTPSPSKSKSSESPSPSVTTQASPQRPPGYGHGRHNSSTGANDSLSTGSRLISSLVIAMAVLFFLILAWKYFSLVPTTSSNSIPICGASGRPHHDCVPHRELNDTVTLYKRVMSMLPAGGEGCAREEARVSTGQVVASLGDFQAAGGASVEDLLRNLVLLLRQNPGWGVAVLGPPSSWEETTLSMVSRRQSWLCWAAGVLWWVWSLVMSVAGWILSGAAALVAVWLGYTGYKRVVVRRARERREVFALVEQATDILFRSASIPFPHLFSPYL